MSMYDDYPPYMKVSSWILPICVTVFMVYSAVTLLIWLTDFPDLSLAEFIIRQFHFVSHLRLF